MVRFLVPAFMLLAVAMPSSTNAQNYQPASPGSPASGSAAARMRPIGSPSAVRYSNNRSQAPVANRYQETAYQYGNRSQSRLQPTSNVRQVAMLQSGFTSPPLPSNDAAPTGQPTLPGQPFQGQASPVQPLPMPNGQGRPLPSNPAIGSAPNAFAPRQGAFDTRQGAVVSPSDLVQLPQPSLTSGFATVDNCNCVSPASGYTAASGIGCGSNLGYISPVSNNVPINSGLLPQNLGFAAPAAQIPGPAVMPVTPGIGNLGAGNGFGTGQVPRALISLGQQTFPVQVGQGLWGQPVAYVPGQSVRNWVRYFFP